MNSETDIENENGGEVVGPVEPKSSGKSRKVLGCVLVPVVLISLLFGADYAYKNWFAPKVDPNKTKEVVVKKTGSGVEGVPEIKEGILVGFTKEAIEKAEHPLKPALRLARLGLRQMDENIQDYTATIVKQIRYKGNLFDDDHMEVKIRHQRGEGDDKVPFSVYTKMISPQAKLGIEAIYVDTWNNNKIVAHTNGMFNIKRFYLPPDGMLAMREQLHPITMIGMKNLLRQVIEKGERDLAHGECTVEITHNVEIDGRKCVMIEIAHPEKRDHFEFHIARIYLDLEYEVPIGYEGYLWPEEKGGEPLLFEKYIYTNLKVNVGLEDVDFSADNEEYDFPSS